MRTWVEVLGLEPRRATGLRAGARLAALLGGLTPEVSSGRVTFTDENAAKGGLDVCCAMWGRRRLHVEDRATSPRQAVDGALTKVERRLARTRAMDRPKRRRPTTYYAAARVR
jgi:ribosome-associated translation inhibitor RaiA